MCVSGINGKRITLADLRLDIPVIKKDNTEVKIPTIDPSLVPHPVKTDSSDIQSKTPKSGNVTNLNFLDAPTAPAKTPETPAKSTHKPREINTKAVFHDANVATGADIDKILKHYHSPHAGKGQVIVDMCKKYNINPVLMMAIMQQESQFGSKNLKIENQANPFSVHFNHSGKGIKKLRLKDGSLPTFEKSLEGAIKTMLKLSGSSATPLSTAGSKYCETSTWTNLVTSHYKNLLKRY